VRLLLGSDAFLYNSYSFSEIVLWKRCAHPILVRVPVGRCFFSVIEDQDAGDSEFSVQVNFFSFERPTGDLDILGNVYSFS